MTDASVSIVIPAYREGKAIQAVLDSIDEAVTQPFEALVVVDFEDDETSSVVTGRGDARFSILVNSYGRGPANAIRYGIDAAVADTIVVMMADGSDDPRQIDDLARLVQRGVVIAAASRYVSGGQQVGGPLLKTTLSRLAGRSLHLLARVGTRDATNSFKAYSAAFLRDVDIDSRHGFEIGIELTAKARRLRLPVAETPTIWLDRDHGVSNFNVAGWIPHYLRWYFFAFGGRLTPDQIRARVAAQGKGGSA